MYQTGLPKIAMINCGQSSKKTPQKPKKLFGGTGEQNQADRGGDLTLKRKELQGNK